MTGITDTDRMLEYKPNNEKLPKKFLISKMNEKIKILIFCGLLVIINLVLGFLTTNQAFVNLVIISLMFWIIMIIEGMYKHETE